jgi:hypothetical protein
VTRSAAALAGGGALSVLTPAVAGGSVYEDLASFEAAAGVPLHVNDFSTLANGPTGSIGSGADGFAYDIASDAGLMGAFGVVTTAAPGHAVTVAFAGAGVHAVGGEFWAMSELSPLTSEVIIQMADGSTARLTTVGPEFRGYVSDVAITGLTITADWDALPANFNASVALDHLSVGTLAVVPLPPTAWAGLGMLGAIGGVRVWRRHACARRVVPAGAG